MQFDLNINPLDRVIAGFPGVGKSYLFKGNSEQYADSDSSTFDKSDFPANYMRHIAELLGSTDKTIFVSTHDTVRQALIDTGDQELIEGNWWGDRFWGVDLKTNQGQNHLGMLLMKIRSEL